jgi:SagB-type dehydrogenase family enzyme
MEPTEKKRYRYFLKDSVRLTIDFRRTDQSQGIHPPSIEKPYSPDAERFDLTSPDEWGAGFDFDLLTAIKNRKTHRGFQNTPLDINELSFLLWTTQGIRNQINENTALRTVPSAGCRHAFETYLVILNVSGLKTGIYRYLPVEHQLLLEFSEEQLKNRLIDAFLGQSFVGKAAVAFIWTAIPYRMEWRYDLAAHKVIAIDAGHVCQNLYL